MSAIPLTPDPRRRTWHNLPSLAETHPEIAAQWHQPGNGGVTPWHVTAGSSTETRAWICAKGHIWRATPNSRTSGRGARTAKAGCGICANRVLQAGENDLATLNPTIAHELDPSNGITASMLLGGGSARLVSWKCELQHRWLARVKDRTRGNGCPYCTNKVVMRGHNDIASTARHLLAQWDPALNGGMAAEETLGGQSQARHYFKCAVGHVQLVRFSDRARTGNCGVCANQELLVGFNDLATKNPTFAGQLRAENNGGLTPQMVIGGWSNKSYNWTCDRQHTWRATVYDRQSGNGCRKCSRTGTSRVERALFRALSPHLGQPAAGARLPIPWRTNKTMEVDISGTFGLNGVVVEYDSRFYHRQDAQLLRDHDKTEALLAAGYRVVRVRDLDLAHVSIRHTNLLQLDHPYQHNTDERLQTALEPVVMAILAWLNGPDESTS
ncbi:DNA-directed RNA polymerase subunit RPC12/RpoP [Marisediminicola sp. UYEF4]|uniref:zinc-ribbon domain-containing protein n=1 Tax=Marisediminicola sp. UYEF4 TaxID=1756384 RepID=UPI0033926EB9